MGKPRHLVYKRRFNRNVDQSISTRRKSASNLGMPGDDRLSQIAEKFSMDMFQMQRAASRAVRDSMPMTENEAEDGGFVDFCFRSSAMLSACSARFAELGTHAGHSQ